MDAARHGSLTPSALLATIARDVPVVALDLEMTGLDPVNDQIIEIAVLRCANGQIEELSTLVRPSVRLSRDAVRLTGLTDADLAQAPTFAEIADRILGWLEGAVVVAHNAPHDLAFLHREFDRCGKRFLPPPSVDTLLMVKRLFAFQKNNLPAVAEKLGVDAAPAHRALGDARTTLAVWQKMIGIVDPNGAVTLSELHDLLGSLAPNSPLRVRQQHVLKDAFRDHKTVYIEYAVTDAAQVGLVRREIGIWRLRLPYIQAWCYLRDGERVFRLDRIRAVDPAGRDYEIPPHEPRI